MTRKELMPYRTEDRGEFAIGEFKAAATWTESGVKEWLDASHHAGGNWIEGIKRRVRFEIDFGKIDDEQGKALREALSVRPEGNQTPYNISLNGNPLNGLYLHGIMKGESLVTPRGLVFSNELPK